MSNNNTYYFCWTGEWPVSVSNTWNGTKLIMDDDVPEIIKFKT